MVTASPYRPLKTPCLYPTLDTSGLLPCLLVSVVLLLLLVLPVWFPKVVVRSPNKALIVNKLGVSRVKFWLSSDPDPWSDLWLNVSGLPIDCPGR